MSPDIILNSIKERVAQLLFVDSSCLDDTGSLFQLGLDSMQMMTLLNELERHGISISLRELYQDPSFRGIKNLIDQNYKAPKPLVSQNADSNTVRVDWPTMKNSQSFAMTPVQHAYYVGRSCEQVLGGVGCHLYQEFNGQGLNLDRLNAAVAELVQRHPMLNVKFSPDGRQRWSSQPLWQGVILHDLQHRTAQAQDTYLVQLRDRLSHRVLNVDGGQCFDIELVQLASDKHRLIVAIDLLIMDASSFSLFFGELASLIKHQALPAPLVDYDFCSYLAQAEVYQQDAKKFATDYWQTRLADLSPAPALPLAVDPGDIVQPAYHRRCQSYSAQHWSRLKHLSADYGVTPTMVLATVFSLVLSRWSGQGKLLLNLTLFDCLPLHKDIEKMLADFTNIILLDVNLDHGSLVESMRALQLQFSEVYEHRSLSGVEVLRELRKVQSHPHGAPVVFTSNLGRPLYGENIQSSLGQPGWGISQTPQVWIDFVAYEHDKQLFLQWDSIEALFPAGLLDDMFGALNALTSGLISDQAHWSGVFPDILPASQKALRIQHNTSTPLLKGLLHDEIFARAQQQPLAIALIYKDQKITYRELVTQARCLASALISQGLGLGEHVAISMDKDPGQIVSVLGILLAGGVYVPVPPNQPEERRQKIYQSAAIRHVIICENSRHLYGWPSELNYMIWQHTQAEPPLEAQGLLERRVACYDEAYIIYTSGSTGLPKGVVISHQGALNTCMDINRRHQVNESDRILGLAALHFDLSVYDIFGVLCAGGTLVLPEESQRRDPSAWCYLVEQHQVTLWNSVPALFDMLLTFSEGVENTTPEKLRLVMLSGDWIGLTLPQRYKNFNANGVLSAMGGATEASIWSNEFIVDAVDPRWRSIPYGFPLCNQSYRVVDTMARDCPDWVVGELWIGGAGVAMGYCNNPKQTKAQFVEDKGQRWYRTGDMACYWPDGCLEFLGRKDNQVKVGGYRIELGEVDAGIHRIGGIKDGLALAVGEREKHLVAFICLDTQCADDYRELYHIVDAAEGLAKSYARLFPGIDNIKALDNGKIVPPEANSDLIVSHFLKLFIGDNPPAMVDWACEKYLPLLDKWLHHIERNPVSDTDLTDGSLVNSDIFRSLTGNKVTISGILRGSTAAEVLLDSSLSPESLLYREADNFKHQGALITAVKTLAKSLGRPVSLVDYGCRGGLHAQRLLAALNQTEVNYIGLDSSQTFVAQARKRFSQLDHVDIHPIDASTLEALRHKADVVLINNVLHVVESPLVSLRQAATLAAPGAMLMVLEVAKKSALSLVSADLMSPAGISIHDCDEWLKIFSQCNLSVQIQWQSEHHHAFVLRQQARVYTPSHRGMLERLTEHLPAYMVPRRIHFVDALPLTANGKVDRKALLSAMASGTEQKSSAPKVEAPPELAATLQEQLLIDIWQDLLALETVTRCDDFFSLGGDSLAATRCIGRLNAEGYSADLGLLFSKSVLHEFALTLEKDEAVPNAVARIVEDVKNRHQAFPLTEVQQAYWVGRQPGFSLGGVGAHFFLEFSVKNLDISAFDSAWNLLIQRHEMLRAVVRDHQQYILANVPRFSTRVYGVDDFDGAAACKIRRRLSAQVLDPAVWPVFDVQALHNKHNEYRLFISLDNMMLDGLSMQILLSELQTIYQFPRATLPEISVSFRDYVIHIYGPNGRGKPNNDCLKNRAQDYWRQQVLNMPPAPNLPVQSDPNRVGKPCFIRATAHLEKQVWRSLKTLAQQHKITPSTLLLGVYASVLSVWSKQRALTINLTLFDRQPVHESINNVLGDFTSLLLLPWSRDEGDNEQTWANTMERLQQQSAAGLKHSQASAVWVMKELARSQNRTEAAMPVVFTSALGANDDSFLSRQSWLKPIAGISQTPQVWLDHQVYESDGELRFNWDAVEALLPEPLLQAMFSDYCELLNTLALDKTRWSRPLSELLEPLQIRPSTVAFFESQSPANREVYPVQSPKEGALGVPNSGAKYAQICAKIESLFRDLTHLAINSKDNFFDVGASSIQLVQLHILLQKAGYPTVVVTDLFSYPSPSALAVEIESQQKVLAASTGNLESNRVDAAPLEQTVEQTEPQKNRQQRQQKNRLRRGELSAKGDAIT